jgi:hypothetical protein
VRNKKHGFDLGPLSWDAMLSYRWLPTFRKKQIESVVMLRIREQGSVSRANEAEVRKGCERNTREMREGGRGTRGLEERKKVIE